MPRIKLETPNFRLDRRQDGYYVIRYQENGKTKNKATGTKDAREAETVRAQFAADYVKPKLTPNPTISEVIDAYILQRSALVASPETLDYVLAAPKRLLGNLKAETFTQSNVAEYIKQRGQEKPQARFAGRYKGAPVSDATMNKELRMLRAAFNWASSERLLDRTPEFRIELTSGRVRDEWITKEEANALIRVAAPHLALFILIALSTAKRREAILDLTWDNVDLSRPGHEIIHFGDDVGNKKRGSTPIAGNKRLITALTAAKERATTEYVIEWRGAKVEDVKVALTATAKRAGIQHVSSHMLKHTSITWMVQAGVSFERIAKFANTSKEIIERVYGHHSPSFVQEAIAAVAF